MEHPQHPPYHPLASEQQPRGIPRQLGKPHCFCGMQVVLWRGLWSLPSDLPLEELGGARLCQASLNVGGFFGEESF